jgi:hypothetical protein
VSPLSPTQKGIIGQQEFAKLMMLGSDGELEVAAPLTDDERRDLEAHRRRHFTSLAFQVKITTYLEHRYRARHFSIHFLVERDRLINDRRFWYVFAYLDLAAMAFSDPVFLVPSTEVHTHAVPHLRGNTWSFSFQASLAPAARDRWKPYQVATKDVGRRVLKLLAELPRTRPSRQLAALRRAMPPDTVWVKAKGRAAPQAKRSISAR